MIKYWTNEKNFDILSWTMWNFFRCRRCWCQICRLYISMWTVDNYNMTETDNQKKLNYKYLTNCVPFKNRTTSKLQSQNYTNINTQLKMAVKGLGEVDQKYDGMFFIIVVPTKIQFVHSMFIWLLTFCFQVPN